MHFISSLREPESVKKARQMAFNLMSDAPMPQSRYGLSIILKSSFDYDSLVPAAFSGCVDKTVTGPTEQFTHNSLSQLDISEDFAKKFMGAEWSEADDHNKISLFNYAFANDVLIITIPKGVTLTEPIAIDYVLNEVKSYLVSNIFILAEANSSAKILFSRRGELVEHAYVAENIKILAEPGSNVEFVSMQSLPKYVTNIQSRVSIAKQDASVSWSELCLGSEYTKSFVYSKLQGKGASSKISVLYAAHQKQVFDVYTLSKHDEAHTTSNIVTRGVLSDSAKALSRGLITMAENASSANGYEKQDALLLSPDAEADAIPNLEIHNHDVTCSHGSTIGQLDNDVLFYLMARGLSEQEAKEIIVEGYFAPVLEQFEDEAIRTKITEQMKAQVNV